MTDIDSTRPRWVKSSYSDNGGECIELDMANYGAVRDSKDPNGPQLRFTPEALTAFIAAAAQGAFQAEDLA
ncbi:DUF397 domain-containing protein [Kitasatospora cheerisanensis]|uniref:DUF397 domain-containing protein n=1 Tax=Kitasatospora cheerisanensis KCTC 2395 TaxID=1348663 RepID=A0A066YJU3_9ACTN|nr:DUF397 domain-containing protein [Kitasatospora cheerisanensis]KDN81728.1 hypothetical protein KCH_64480 [Kitasatospora cheerisanensis KCTC 2395]